MLEKKGYMPFKEEAFQDLWISTKLINEFSDGPRDVHISLEEFIEFCNFENEAEILELIRDARTNCSQDCEEIDRITTDQEDND
jgi:hypothetical protein